MLTATTCCHGLAVLQVDSFLSLTGADLSTSNYKLAALLGSNTLAMSTLLSTHAMMLGLTNASSDAAAAVVLQAAYSAMAYRANLSTTVGSSVLSTSQTLMAMYADAYDSLQPMATTVATNTTSTANTTNTTLVSVRRRQLMASLTAANLQSVFQAIAQVCLPSANLL